MKVGISEDGSIEETTEKNLIARGLNTTLTLQVYREVRGYSENLKDGFGKWSFNTGFRSLLDKAKAFDLIAKEIESIKIDIKSLKEEKK